MITTNFPDYTPLFGDVIFRCTGSGFVQNNIQIEYDYEEPDVNFSSNQSILSRRMRAARMYFNTAGIYAREITIEEANNLKKDDSIFWEEVLRDGSYIELPSKYSHSKQLEVLKRYFEIVLATNPHSQKYYFVVCERNLIEGKKDGGSSEHHYARSSDRVF